MFEIEDGGEQYCITALGNGMDSKRGSTRWHRLEFSIKPKISLDVRRSYSGFAMMCRTNWTFITERRPAYIDGFDRDSIRSVVSFAMLFFCGPASDLCSSQCHQDRRTRVCPKFPQLQFKYAQAK